jgi:hypothetical protein
VYQCPSCSFCNVSRVLHHRSNMFENPQIHLNGVCVFCGHEHICQFYLHTILFTIPFTFFFRPLWNGNDTVSFQVISRTVSKTVTTSKFCDMSISLRVVVLLFWYVDVYWHTMSHVDNWHPMSTRRRQSVEVKKRDQGMCGTVITIDNGPMRRFVVIHVSVWWKTKS